MTTWLEQQMSDPEFRLALAQEEPLMEFLDALHEAMQAQELSRSALARRYGTTCSYVSQVFRGHRALTLSTASKLAHACGYRLRVTLEKED
jgi:antitoxin component HigA of HigAB toxin-antitoxin module